MDICFDSLHSVETAWKNTYNIYKFLKIIYEVRYRIVYNARLFWMTIFLFLSPNNGGFCVPHSRPNRKLVSSYCGGFGYWRGRRTAPKHEKRIAVYNVYRYMGCAEVRPQWSCQCFSIPTDFPHLYLTASRSALPLISLHTHHTLNSSLITYNFFLLT